MATVEECQASFRPFVSSLLDIIFRTYEEIQVKELNDAMRVIVQNFTEEIQPYAVQITNSLLKSFWEQVQRVEQQD